MILDGLVSILMNLLSSLCYDKLKAKLARNDSKKLNKRVRNWKKEFVESNKYEISKSDGVNFCINNSELQQNIYDFIFNTMAKR